MSIRPLLLAAGALLVLVTAAPAQAHWDDYGWRREAWRAHEWRERAWHEHAWREHEWRERARAYSRHYGY
jgi:hypothetical protein